VTCPATGITSGRCAAECEIRRGDELLAQHGRLDQVLEVTEQLSPVFHIDVFSATEEDCTLFLERFRSPQGLYCIRCDGRRVRRLESVGKTGRPRHLYWCSACRYQYSVTTGTVFQGSHLPLRKWFTALYLICSAENRDRRSRIPPRRRKADLLERLARSEAVIHYHKAIAEQLHEKLAIAKITALFLSCRIDRALAANDKVLWGVFYGMEGH
jgi:hypothetical protein